MRKCIGILILAVLFSCAEEKKKPDYLWEEDRMVEVMTEIQLAETIVRMGYHRYRDSMHLNDSVFNAALRKVNATRVDFDSNYNYYEAHPDQLEKVFERVINNLSSRSAELHSEQQAEKEDNGQAESPQAEIQSEEKKE